MGGILVLVSRERSIDVLLIVSREVAIFVAPWDVIPLAALQKVPLLLLLGRHSCHFLTERILVVGPCEVSVLVSREAALWLFHLR